MPISFPPAVIYAILASGHYTRLNVGQLLLFCFFHILWLIPGYCEFFSMLVCAISTDSLMNVCNGRISLLFNYDIQNFNSWFQYIQRLQLRCTRLNFWVQRQHFKIVQNLTPADSPDQIWRNTYWSNESFCSIHTIQGLFRNVTSGTSIQVSANECCWSILIDIFLSFALTLSCTPFFITWCYFWSKLRYFQCIILLP